MTPEMPLYIPFVGLAVWFVTGSLDLYYEWKWEKQARAKGCDEYYGWPRP